MLQIELRLGIGGKELKEIKGNTFPDIIVMAGEIKAGAVVPQGFRYVHTDEQGTGVYIEANLLVL